MGGRRGRGRREGNSFFKGNCHMHVFYSLHRFLFFIFPCGVWQRICQCLARAEKLISCCLKLPVLLVRQEHSSESSVTWMRRCTHFRRKADEEAFLSTPVTHSRYYRYISPSHVAFILLHCITAFQTIQIGMYDLTSGVWKRPMMVTSSQHFPIQYLLPRRGEIIASQGSHYIIGKQINNVNVTTWDCKICW